MFQTSDDPTSTLACLARVGDQSAMKTLAQEFVPLVCSLARASRGFGEFDELVAEANLGLLKAIRDYRGTTPFAFFARLVISRQLGQLRLKAGRRWKYERELPPQFELDYDGEDGENRLEAGVQDQNFHRIELGSDPLHKLLLYGKIADFIDEGLTEPEARAIVLRRYGFTAREIGIILSESADSAEDTISRAMTKVRKRFGIILKSEEDGLLEPSINPANYGLSPDQLQAVALHREGITNCQIAEQMGRTPGAVAKLLCKARKKIRN